MEATWDQPKFCPSCSAVYRGNFARCPADGHELATSDQDPLIGTTVADTYVVDNFLGEGATGRVYRCHHRRLQKKEYALKVLLGDLALDATMRNRFTQEAEAASRLSHPNVVSVIDFGQTDGGVLYIIMELVTGETLADHIRKVRRMSESDVILLSRDICRGLAHAHEAGLVHRDFKPENVALQEQDGSLVPRILDFGLAIVKTKEESSARLTKTGLVVGTPAYASPEQIAAGEIDHRTDLFAVGIAMYEMLAGVLPFEGNLMEILVANSSTMAPRFSERVPGLVVSPALEAVVNKLIAKHPDDRFQSARDLLAALDDLAVDNNLAVPISANTPAYGTQLGPATAARSVVTVDTSIEDAGAATMLGVEVTQPAPRSEEPANAPALSTMEVAAPHTKRRAVILAVALSVLGLAAAGAGIWYVASDPLSGNSSRQGTATDETNNQVNGGAEPDRIASLTIDAGQVNPAADAASETSATDAAATDKPEIDEPIPRRPDPKPDPAVTKPDPVVKPDPKPDPVVKPDPKPDPVVKPDPKPDPVVKPDPKPDPVVKPNPVKPIPKPAKRPALDATFSISGFSASGSLPTSDVKRVVQESRGKYRSCYREAAAAAKKDFAVSLKVSFKVSETRRATAVAVTGKGPKALKGCIQSAVNGTQVLRAPDTGGARGSFVVKFNPKPPL